MTYELLAVWAVAAIAFAVATIAAGKRIGRSK